MTERTWILIEKYYDNTVGEGYTDYCAADDHTQIKRVWLDGFTEYFETRD